MGERFLPAVGKKDAIGLPCLMSDSPARPTTHFLKKSADFARVKRVGRRRQSALFNLVYCSTSRPETGFGIVVGRRFGNAVKRNRAKRLVRELVRATQQLFVQGKDCIVFPRRQMLDVGHPLLKETWLSVLDQEELIHTCS